MNCAWKELIQILPGWMKEPVDKLGAETIQELRVRMGLALEVVTKNGSYYIDRKVSKEDLSHIVNIASQYSPWTAETISKGYITSSGGHRIGICGEAVVNNSVMFGIRSPTSLCVRVAKDYSGIARDIPMDKGSVLLIGGPGCGKTTLLRDLIRRYSDNNEGAIGVIDERGELFPVVQGTSCFLPGRKTDIMTGCSKAEGLITMIRTMNPSCVAVDEITQPCDCEALIQAAWCGVKLFATAHASNRHDLLSRSIYSPLIASNIFNTLVVLQKDKSWKAERM